MRSISSPEALNSFPSSILIITDQRELGASLTRVAQIAAGKQSPVYSFTFSESPALLNPQRIQQTDLLLLELFRNYPGGIRAEGITLAERWLYRKPFLIVSPLHLSQRIQCFGYWDTAAEDTLVDRIQRISTRAEVSAARFDGLKNFFSALLKIPPQH